ncbi:MAG: hypothetical protein AAF743_09515, partial [Planctomycetota bacterium]
MAKTKGKRISDLAKELGIPSKQVTAKLKAEGLSNTTGKAYTASATVPIGLEMTIRDWFKDAAAQAEAAPKKTVKKAPKKAPAKKEPEAEEAVVVEEEAVETVAKSAPSSAKVAAESGDDIPAADDGNVAVMDPPAGAPVEDFSTPDDDEPSVDDAVEEEPPAAAAEAPTPTPTPTPAPISDEPVVQPKISLASAADSQGPNVRPTITLENREDLTPAPQLTKLKPAEIQGPKVVREEAPEPDAGPRRRPAQRPGGPSSTAGPGGTRFGPNAKTGGGVKAKIGESEEKKKDAGRSLSTRRRGDRRGEAMEKL